jgi:hypothetical protein
MNDATEQIAFTRCTFKDCNIDSIEPDESRGLVSRENIFEPPLEDQRKDFDERLEAFLSKRSSKL